MAFGVWQRIAGERRKLWTERLLPQGPQASWAAFQRRLMVAERVGSALVLLAVVAMASARCL